MQVTLMIGLCIGAAAATVGTATAAPPADALRHKLQKITAGGKTMFGHHDDPVYGHTWSYEKGRSDALETAGSLPAMFSWDLGGIENGDSLNLDGVPFRLIRENAIELNRNGGVNTFSWHLRNPINNNDSWTVSDTTIVRQMMENPESFRRQLTNLAGFFNSLVDENGRSMYTVL